MFIRKRYGESRIDPCPFCGANAFVRSDEGIPVCADHKSRKFPEVKCACGNFLFRKEGKFGLFFICEKCGTKNMRTVIEMNPQIREKSFKQQARAKAYKAEDGSDKFVRSDDPRFEFR